MKHIFKIFCFLSVLLMLFVMPVMAGDYTAVLSISGTTTALNQSNTYSGTSWYPTIDTFAINPVQRSFSVQVYEVDFADSNQNNITITSGNASGATYQLVYSVSNVDTTAFWTSSGVTDIGGPIALSGSSVFVQTFTPEFAKYLKIGIVSGMTQFDTFKTVIAIQ